MFIHLVKEMTKDETNGERGGEGRKEGMDVDRRRIYESNVEIVYCS